MSPARCAAQAEYAAGKYATCDRYVDAHEHLDHRDASVSVDWPVCSQYCLINHAHGRYRRHIGQATGPATLNARAPKVSRSSARKAKICTVCMDKGELGKDGRCIDRAACAERAPQLDLGLS